MGLVIPYILLLLPLFTPLALFLGSNRLCTQMVNPGEGDAGGTGGTDTEVDSTGIEDCGTGGTKVAGSNGIDSRDSPSGDPALCQYPQMLHVV